MFFENLEGFIRARVPLACSSGRFNASVGVAVIEETKDFGELTDGLNNTELVAHFIEHVALERK